MGLHFGGFVFKDFCVRDLAEGPFLGGRGAGRNLFSKFCSTLLIKFSILKPASNRNYCVQKPLHAKSQTEDERVWHMLSIIKN